MELVCHNVNDAFEKMLMVLTPKSGYGSILTRKPYKNPTGEGFTLGFAEPMVIRYQRSTDRVLFHEGRNANPFFLLYEALWMLAGRNDLAPLLYYNKRMGEFSDDGKVFNAAYGERWRKCSGRIMAMAEGDQKITLFRRPLDQIEMLVELFKEEPDTRRAVLQIWSITEDLWKVKTSKDVACNLCVKFKLRIVAEKESGFSVTMEADGTRTEKQEYLYALDMTVFNRSNDILWGMLGSDYVCFSILQEYLAAALGVLVGNYWQISDDAHVYEDRWKGEKWLSEIKDRDMFSPDKVSYDQFTQEQLIPLVQDKETFDRELLVLVEQYSGKEPMGNPFQDYTEPFLRDVAQPVLDAWLSYKKGTNTALDHVKRVRSEDWKIACTRWLNKKKGAV